MAKSIIQSESINLADTFAFTGTVSGAGAITASTNAPTEGGAATTNVVQGLAKGWYHLDNDYTGGNPNASQTNGVTIEESFNVSGIVDHNFGDFTISWTNDFNNNLYTITQQGQYRDDETTWEYGFMCTIQGSPAAGSYRWRWSYYTGSFYDPSHYWALAHGDLA